MEFKKGDRVTMQDGTILREGTVVEDGVNSKNRVRVRPDGIPMDMSISIEPNNQTYIIT
jgi:hypothetical protein